MTDINIYADQTAINALTPISGDVVLRASDNAVLLYNGSAWKEFQPDAGAFSNDYSVSHDGSNEHITLTSSITFSGAFTISMWIKPSGSGTRMFLGMYGSANLYCFVNNTGRITFVPVTAGVGINTSGVAVSNDSWYNIIIIRDASDSINVYVDGTSYGSGVRSGTLTCGTLNHPSYAYEGLIDEVAMWDSDQTTNLASISGEPSNLGTLTPLHWWRMGDNDPGTGTTITDQGSGSNDAELQNGATFVSGSGNTPGN